MSTTISEILCFDRTYKARTCRYFFYSHQNRLAMPGLLSPATCSKTDFIREGREGVALIPSSCIYGSSVTCAGHCNVSEPQVPYTERNIISNKNMTYHYYYTMGYELAHTFDSKNFLSEIINLHESHMWIIPSLFFP